MYHALWVRQLAGQMAVTAAVACCSFGWSAAAQETIGTGVLNAVSYAPIPDGAMAVRVLDDSDQNLAIRDKIVAALSGRGVAVANATPASVMVLSVNQDPGSYSAPLVQDLTTRLPSQTGTAAARAEVNLSRLIEAPLPQWQMTTPSSYQLRVVIEPAQGSGTLWEGWATASLRDGLPSTLADRMIPHLLDAMGQTIRAETFELF